MKKYNKEYNKNNRDKINKTKNVYEKNKRKNDPLYRLKCNCRTRIYFLLKSKGIKKNKSTTELLGCSYNTLMQHIKSKFTKNMTIEKLGIEIHLDHIIPLSSANTENKLIQLFHFTNLQPLWAEDNLKKGSKINHKNT